MGPSICELCSSTDRCLERLPGPIPTPVLSEVDMLLCRGELGRLLFWGSGGGPIAEEVRREWDGYVCWGIAGAGAAGTLSGTRGDRGTEFRSGDMLVDSVWKGIGRLSFRFEL